MKSAVLAAVAKEGWLAMDVGEVLVSIGAAMMKGGGSEEAQFISYCQKVWAAQQPKVSN